MGVLRDWVAGLVLFSTLRPIGGTLVVALLFGVIVAIPATLIVGLPGILTPFFVVFLVGAGMLLHAARRFLFE